ncbi:MAG TPA: serine/threonine-protein kinase [Gaiellaceae bacterium]|nr:serine/threonine-protein kinase [Gaiellaceae bacterium]
MPSTAAQGAPGSLVLNRYLPVRPLGTGGSGSVWLAREVETGREVALKIVPREGTAGSRAEREAAAAARLRHPRCLRAHALARDSKHVYIVYEYVEGRTLRDAMRAGEISDAAALEAAAQVLEGLAHAHAHGIVHRDVKPANVLLADGRTTSVKLFDFGLALMREEQSLTAAGDIPGTLAYISPERLKNEPAGPAADVWGVGVLLWEALAGFHPFWGGTLLDMAKSIGRGAPTLRDQRPDLPRPIVACVDRALSVAPGRRPTAATLAGALRQAATELRRRPVRKGSHLRVTLPQLHITRPSLRTDRRLAEHAQRAVAIAGAAALSGMSTAAMPFFPTGWWAGIALLAAGLTWLSELGGLAFCLAVPILPLGNYSFGLAALYSIVAALVLVASRRTPRAGLLAALGAGLGPIGALGLVPIAGLVVRWPARRAVSVAGAVLAGAAFGAAAHVERLGIPGANSLVSAGRALGRQLIHHPQVLSTAGALALGAAVLPLLRRRGPLAAAAYALVVGGLTVVPAPHTPNVAILAVTGATGLALALEPYAPRLRPRRRQAPVDETTASIALPPEARSAAARR